ncbi:TPA: hypothetical protein ACSQRE_001790 [Clostridium perfringens]
MIGNKRLFSIYECKECNKNFGCSCEDSFGKYILPFKIVSEVFGRNKTMCHSEQFGEIRMNNSEPIMPHFNNSTKNLIKETKQGELLTMTDDGFKLRLKRKRYTPEWIYFSLLKMALGIMPFELINKYVYALATLKVVINNKSERDKILNLYVIPGVIEFIPGKMCFSEINLELFKRKPTAPDEYPLCYFCLNFGHYSLQIPLQEDFQRNGKKIKLCAYQHFLNSNIEVNDFHTVEEEFICEFSADKKDLSKEEIMKLNNIKNLF